MKNRKFAYLILVWFHVVSSITQTFQYTGSYQEFVVPASVRSIEMTLIDAQRGGASLGAISRKVPVEEGQKMYIFVGGAGSCTNSEGVGADIRESIDCSGGGATEVRRDLNDLSSKLVTTKGGGRVVFTYDVVEELFTRSSVSSTSDEVKNMVRDAVTEDKKDEPSAAPTEVPTNVPTVVPSEVPTNERTEIPTEIPTEVPTEVPSFVAPTVEPSTAPSLAPSVAPTVEPTTAPSVGPTMTPTENPTVEPTGVPFLGTASPTYSKIPSVVPSKSPSVLPSVKPSNAPSELPTQKPTTTKPTTVPSVIPSVKPSNFPTVVPTQNPTTDKPSKSPTLTPSVKPSNYPSVVPTQKPTTDRPSKVPTIEPSLKPNLSLYPTKVPTVQPSAKPTIVPSELPTQKPSTAKPSTSLTPTVQDSVVPSFAPSVEPSVAPTSAPLGTNTPTVGPSILPSLAPPPSESAVPTRVPSVGPSFIPSLVPSFAAGTSAAPSRSRLPTLKPSIQPSAAPSVVPSMRPSTAPSKVPSVKLTREPTMAPSSVQYYTFSVIQNLYGINKAVFVSDPNNAQVFAAATAASMPPLNPSDVTINTVTDVTTSTRRKHLLRSRHLLTYSEVSVVYSVIYFLTATGYNTSDAAYSSLSQSLNASVASGDFNSLINTYSVSFDAADMFGVTSNSVSTSAPTQVLSSDDDRPSNSDQKQSNLALILGLVLGLGGVICCILVCLSGSCSSYDDNEEEKADAKEMPQKKLSSMSLNSSNLFVAEETDASGAIKGDRRYDFIVSTRSHSSRKLDKMEVIEEVPMVGVKKSWSRDSIPLKESDEEYPSPEFRSKKKQFV